jgi:S-disulfanyl-L-cysteine oxidoreductase SoxD
MKEVRSTKSEGRSAACRNVAAKARAPVGRWLSYFVLCTSYFIGAAAAAQSTTTETTVADRVYSADQAKRGRAGYDQKCASCHDGGTMGPELWGDAFLTAWENKTAGTFFKRIKDTMPEDAPGSLADPEVLDIIAYVIQTNGFPAGEKPLDSADALAAMKFVRKR